ncbi:MAG TPA: hypothetical protein VKB88_32940 [Bryobacteraceae bacterium]|nr:hypothetical protein [Bryobacteraceae bacterium]
MLTTTMKHFGAIIIVTGQAGPSLAARFAGTGKTVQYDHARPIRRSRAPAS